MPTPAELIAQKIMPLDALLRKAQLWRFKNEKLVFSNGCFDILHQGHLHTLGEAAALGTKLIVGLNSDASVRHLKGETRPVQDQQSRAMLLAALFFVDAVVIFDEATPYNLIAALQPDLLVKGGDYDTNSIVGADVVQAKGGKVLTIPFLAGFSTTNILKK
jgi:rfaE bifunctional protein nucleotidyltransferase chain/domain